jgi:hypothetical protein
MQSMNAASSVNGSLHAPLIASAAAPALSNVARWVIERVYFK